MDEANDPEESDPIKKSRLARAQKVQAILDKIRKGQQQ